MTLSLLLVAALAAGDAKPATTSPNPKVRLETSKGAIVLELDAAKAPKTVENFLAYVRAGHFNGTIFHRVIPGFMIQGGGFTAEMEQKPTNPPIKNEADNGLQNRRGTIAMARTPDPDSASSQFFVNLADNAFLDFKSKTPQGWGYTVFGKVVSGMDAVDAIAKVATKTAGSYQNVPVEPVKIVKATIEK